MSTERVLTACIRNALAMAYYESRTINLNTKQELTLFSSRCFAAHEVHFQSYEIASIYDVSHIDYLAVFIT